jgi:mycothiol synthase
MFEIRVATETDYPRLCEIFNAIEPDHFHTVESMLEENRKRDPKCKYGEFVALKDGVIVAQADYGQFSGMYHPQKFSAWFHTHPDHWDSGVQDALYDHLLRELEGFDPISLLSNTRENRAHEIAWLEARGFAVKQRTWENVLKLEEFDVTRWADRLEGIARAGFSVKAMSDFDDTGAFRHALFDLWSECRRDVPRPEATSEIGFEQFVKHEFESAYLLREGYFVALDSSRRMVAMTALWRDDEDGVLNIGLTGTRAANRRQGLALGLKIASLLWAKGQGYERVRTWNEQNNAAILEINAVLGFERQPAWIDYLKVFDAP